MSLWRPATFARALSSYGAKITMATIGQVKDLLKKELEPLHSKLETMSTESSESRTSVQLFSDKYDDLLKQIKQSKEKLHQQRTDLSKTNSEVNNIKKDLLSMEEQIANACYEIEELGQYFRRDCLEISGIKATSDCSAESIVQSVGKAIDVPVNEQDISIAHPIPSYNAAAPPKIIVKFTRRSVRNTFYSNRRKLANKKARDLPDLDLESDASIFISESLTPYKKKLFGNVNKEKKRLKWKFIWTFNGRIFIRNNEHSPVVTFDTEDDLKRFQDEHPRTH